MDKKIIYVNGIDGSTGNYLLDPMSASEIAELAAGKPQQSWLTGWLDGIVNVLRSPFLGLPMGVEPTDIARAGWAIVFPKNTPPEVRVALEPLIEHRSGHVPPDRCKILEYETGEEMRDWLTRYGGHLADVVPTKVPYYVTLVGHPTDIPFDFQYLLDIEYAVGRLAFDHPDDYRQYAESVIAYETATTVLPTTKEIAYWGTRHPYDDATQMSADYLITPLFQGISEGDQPEEAIANILGYRSRCLKTKEATKTNLLEVLHARGDMKTPAMLMTASHGIGMPKGHAQQSELNGALLCQDWTGFGTHNQNHYLTAAEIEGDAKLHGLIAFIFACYGAGTPALDNFLKNRDKGPVPIAEQPFVSALSKSLLSHPQGSALAVIGHVERAWGYSIQPPGIGTQIQPFQKLIGRILAGEPVGHATKDFSERYAALAADLLRHMDTTQNKPKPADEELAWTWIEHNDARNYVVLGDPAVRIRVDLLK